MSREENFLNIINNTLCKNSFIGDDCAIVPDFNMAISTDTLVQDIHFKLNAITPYMLGRKSLLVNISDILASGATPKYILIAISGKLDENFIENFYKGVDEICTKYNIEVIGGDLTGGDKISISVTILGNTENRNISSRKNARDGYVVYIAGEHGSSAMGLKELTLGKKKSRFIDFHQNPILYPEISASIAKNAKFPYAMMDTSDGLFDALNKISNASGVGFNIDYTKIPKQIDDFDLVMFGGEDYGLLICVNEKDAIYLNNASCVGHVTNTGKIIVDGREINEDLSFEHFQD